MDLTNNVNNTLQSSFIGGNNSKSVLFPSIPTERENTVFQQIKVRKEKKKKKNSINH